MSFLLHSPPPEVNMIRPTSQFTEHISSPQIPRITITPAQCGRMRDLGSLSDSDFSDSYLEMSDIDDSVPKLEDVTELISKTTEKGVALTAEYYPFYRMLVDCSSADDTASGADAAVQMVVRQGFHFARRNMVKRRKCLIGGRSLWLVRAKQEPLPKIAPHITYEEQQDISNRLSTEAPHITYEKKQDISNRLSTEAPHITYEEQQDISNRLSKEAPHITYEQKKNISNLVNCLPEPEMEIALNIIRGGMPKLKDTVNDELEIDIDELPNEVLQSLLRFVRVHSAPH